MEKAWKQREAAPQSDLYAFHSCRVAHTKVGFVCLQKETVLRYQIGPENKNHNRMWVEVTEKRVLFVCVELKMWDFPTKRNKNLIHIFLILF